jgi:hypothetical protein
MFFKRLIRRLATGAFPELANIGARLRAIESAFSVLATEARYENDDGAFNGQAIRRELATDIILRMKPSTIVETGTFLGSTTGYLARFDALVHSSEISAPLYFAARQRLAQFRNVTLTLGDSREMLARLIANGVNASPAFFYLDAHWHDDLPLLDEVTMIDEHWASYIALVDDFEVPGDPGYGYDDYGRNKVLRYAYLEPCLRGKPIEVFFPNARSHRETGGRRGCVFLAKGIANTRILRDSEGLSPFPARHGQSASGE